MKKYEVMVIINANLDDEARKVALNGLQEVITSNGGSISNVDEWGMKDLAYPIDHMKKGYYAVIKFAADNACVAEFDRLTRINKNIVRHMITVDQA